MILRGVICDLDGLLIDSEMWSWQAHNEVLRAQGLPRLSLEEVRRLVGLDGDDEWHTLCSLRPIAESRAAYYRAHGEAFIALRSRALAPMPGVHELLGAAARLDLRLGLASNSHMPSILAALQGLGIRDRFTAVVSADEVPQGKPQPDVYLLALERLGLGAAQAIAVEDSRAGLAAAQAAGLFCVVVPSELTAGQDLSAAQQRFASLYEVAAWLPEHVMAGERH
jgi:HAD superfamily hydrolase (TIGR01509 family)